MIFLWLLLNYKTSVLLRKIYYLEQMQTDNTLQPISLHSKAYRFFPKREEEKSSFDKKGTRYYFLGQIQHDQYQLRKLKQFHEYAQKKGKIYNKQIFPNDHTILLLLASNKYKPKETLKVMEEYCEFRLVKVPSLVNQKVEGLLKSGFYYVCGRDNFFRPIIVFRVKMIDQNKLDLATDALIFAMEQICNKMLIPGQVQNWNFIYDLGGINNLLDLPITAIKKVVTSLQMLYSFKLWRSFVLNAPSSISMFFKLVSAFMDDATVQKTKINKESTDKSLFENIHPSQIQQKYGGTQQNRVEYYPFTVPKAVYNQNRLMSDQQYEKLLKQGKLLRNKLDPVYVDKKQ